MTLIIIYVYSRSGGCHWLTNDDLDVDMLIEGIRQTNKIKESDIPDINLDGGQYIKKIIESKITYN